MFCGGYDNHGKVGDSGGGFYFKDDHFWAIRGIVSGLLNDEEHGCDISKF